MIKVERGDELLLNYGDGYFKEGAVDLTLGDPSTTAEEVGEVIAEDYQVPDKSAKPTSPGLESLYTEGSDDAMAIDSD